MFNSLSTDRFTLESNSIVNVFREGTKEIGRVLYRERVEAAVDNANRTGHGLGGIGGQIMKGSHQFIRLQETSDRSMGENRMRTRCKRTVLIGQQGAVLIRQKETRAIALTRMPSPNFIASSAQRYLVQFATAALATP